MAITLPHLLGEGLVLQLDPTGEDQDLLLLDTKKEETRDLLLLLTDHIAGDQGLLPLKGLLLLIDQIVGDQGRLPLQGLRLLTDPSGEDHDPLPLHLLLPLLVVIQDLPINYLRKKFKNVYKRCNKMAKPTTKQD